MDETRTDVIAGIVASMRDPSWTVRVEALRNAAATLGTGTVEEADELRLAPLLVEAARDAKWEVRKEAAIALAECRHQRGVPDVLATLERDENRWVSQAAERAGKRMRARASRAEQWQLSPDAQDPTLQYITQRIREIGLRSMTPAHIYELAMEISEQSYRDLAADTAHELNTLLTPFEGYLVAARRRLEGRRADATLIGYLDKALGRLQQIQLLTDTLSTYSLPTEADFAPVDVAAVVRDAVAIGHDRATSRDDGERPAITHAISVPAGLVIDALRDRLLRAIANLVANACQAMPDGGTLAVRARGEADTLTIEIADTGRGMNPEQIEKARLRFGTTRRDEGGTGLGIPIAERIVKEDHGGDLLIESTPSIGTTVTLILPVRRSIDQ